MNKEITKRKLTINCLSDNMVNCAIEKGFMLPVVSVKHHYGKPAEFIENYKDGTITDYILNIFNRNKLEAIYRISL